MVTLQILVLPFLVRVRIPQQKVKLLLRFDFFLFLTREIRVQTTYLCFTRFISSPSYPWNPLKPHETLWTGSPHNKGITLWYLLVEDLLTQPLWSIRKILTVTVAYNHDTTKLVFSTFPTHRVLPFCHTLAYFSILAHSLLQKKWLPTELSVRVATINKNNK